MTMHLDNRSLYAPLLTAKNNPPITFDWSTTIQSLSTDLRDYDLTLELTTTKDTFTDFFSNGGVLKAEKPLFKIEHLFATPRTARFAYGATFLIHILAGQKTLNEATDLVRDLRETHKQKADYMKEVTTEIYHGRIVLKGRFSINQTRHSFSVGDVHQLAQSLSD